MYGDESEVKPGIHHKFVSHYSQEWSAGVNCLCLQKNPYISQVNISQHEYSQGDNKHFGALPLKRVIIIEIL